MNSQPVILLLRLVHIVCGVLSVGGAMVLTAFVLPAARHERGLAYLREILWKRNLPRFLNVTLLLALLSGLAMYGNLYVATYGTWARTRVGLALGAGGALAILAALIATFVAAPAVHRALQLSSDSPEMGAANSAGQPPAVEQALSRYALAMKLVVTLLIGTAALMGIARYL